MFKDIATGRYKTIFRDNDDADNHLREWLDNREDVLLCGFNNKHYDDHILKAIYYGFTIADIKDLNDFIIGGGQGWEWSKWNYHKLPFETYDIRDDLPITLSLKEIEGNMGLNIMESPVPFDLDRPLTVDEWVETVKYCKWDVDATDKLRLKRQAYLESKVYVGELAGLTPGQAMGMTNAKLTAAYLAGRGLKPKVWGDDIDYQCPDNVIVDHVGVKKFFSTIDPTYKANETVTIADVKHTLAYGGLHGARPNYIGISKDGRKLVNVDVTSYYPSLMIKNGYVSRAVSEPSDFEQVYHERVEAKKNGDKAKNEALKLVLNTTYGTMKNQYNALYDPLMANSVCISGQLYLIDLIEKLNEIPSVSLIQSNTDGILIEHNEEDTYRVQETVLEWERRTGFEMEFDDVDRIFQKDVNNYVMQTADGKIKVKGGYVTNYKGGDFENASLTIVAKAIVEYLLNGVPVEDTIHRATDILDFQIIAKTGRTYDCTVQEVGGELIEVQRVNRVYASPNQTLGTLYKLKKEVNRKDKIANLPDHCLIDNGNKATLDDIDKQFYIDMAHKRIQDFHGEKPSKTKRKKEESSVTPAAKETITTTTTKSFLEKIFELRKELSSYVWEKDGKNIAQKYKYITEAQYKKYFEKALETVGLDYACNIDSVEFIRDLSESNSGNKSHLTQIKATYLIIDPITGDGRSYTSFGQGADQGDKGVYKAITGALKYFIANNFLIAENNDPESDEDEKPKSNRPAAPEKREEIKKELMAKDEPATAEQKELIKQYRDQLKVAGGHDEIVTRINTTMKAKPTKVAAGALIMDLEEIIEELDDANE